MSGQMVTKSDQSRTTPKFGHGNNTVDYMRGHITGGDGSKKAAAKAYRLSVEAVHAMKTFDTKQIASC